jgi:DNA polymerase III subunit delta'
VSAGRAREAASRRGAPANAHPVDDARSAPWIEAQCAELSRQGGHALLLHGPSGLGQYALALALARRWLCLAPVEGVACGQCSSCHAIEVRTHGDLCVLMPETLAMELGWPLDEKAQADIDDKKRKPSREIRVEAMRDAIEFSQRTSAGDHGKVILIFPAERMNAVTANALLKTLEEPPGDSRFLLASESAQDLMPTIRSRCIGVRMRWPTQQESVEWLIGQGIDATDAPALLQAFGGRPDDALGGARAGFTGRNWAGLPRAIQRGDVAALQELGASVLVDLMQKLCHDLHRQRHQQAPRYFRSEDLPEAPTVRVLADWARSLSAARRTVDHPFQAGLQVEALLGAAKIALHSSRSSARR